MAWFGVEQVRFELTFDFFLPRSLFVRFFLGSICRCEAGVSAFLITGPLRGVFSWRILMLTLTDGLEMIGDEQVAMRQSCVTGEFASVFTGFENTASLKPFPVPQKIDTISLRLKLLIVDC